MCRLRGRRVIFAALLSALLLAAACGQAPAPGGHDEGAEPAAGAGDTAKPVVYATVFAVYDFTRQVAGPDANVRLLVPYGTEPHDWEPSPRDVEELARADLLVYNGAGMEPWLARIVASLPASVRRVDAGAGIELLRVPAGGDHDIEAGDGEGDHTSAGDDGHGQPAGAQVPDPHVWLDPLRAARQVDNIAAALAEADPARADAYRERARALRARLDELDGSFRRALASCASRDLLTTHAAFGYLADRYGLHPHSVSGLSHGLEPSPARLAELVRLVRERGIRAVFFEELVSSRVAEALAAEAGVASLPLSPIEGLTREQAARGIGYFELMEQNLDSLVEGLGCRP